MKKYFLHIFLLVLIICWTECIHYDRFSGEKVNDARLKEFQLSDATKTCTIDVKPCTPHEGRRIDGSCNNYKYPSLGTAKGPYSRLLMPEYAENGDVKKSKNGKSLPSARQVRTSLQSTGRVTDKIVFNVAAVHFLEFICRDISVLFDPNVIFQGLGDCHNQLNFIVSLQPKMVIASTTEIVNCYLCLNYHVLGGEVDYLTKGQDCCHLLEEKDSHCMPIEVPEDDPYLKVTDIRCLNFTRAETFQDVGCISKSMLPEHINLQTPAVDLSTIYGFDEKSMNSVRKWEDGLLKTEKRNDRIVPLVNTTKHLYLQNENETNCYTFGFPDAGNLNLRTTSIAIFFMREHNRLAKILHELNPCWKDDRLFKIARQINIATAANIFMYELLPVLLGHRNMINYGLISDRIKQVTVYDEDALPIVFAEYEIATRFFHTLLDGRIKKYDEKYNYVDELPYSDTLYRQEVLEKNHNFEEINRGTFYQNAAKMDDIQDPEISEHYFGHLQKAHDLAASDIQRGRDLGMAGYNEYRRICGLKAAKTFEDFSDVIDIEKVAMLRHLYEDVDDVDLLAGIMSENFIKDTFVGPTLFCIMARQMNVFRLGDRFWFERGDQLHSFSLHQLHEVRKTNLARLACDNAEGIKYIQPQAFLNMRMDNAPVSCSYIPGADLTRWRDRNCYKENDNNASSHNHSSPPDELLSMYNNLLSIKPNFEFQRV